MTEGISKRELEIDLCLLSASDDYPGEKAMLMHLIARCTELDPWLPIDENTPKGRELLMFTRDLGQLKGSWANYPFRAQHVSHWQDNRGVIIYPTHYKLLPEDPK